MIQTITFEATPFEEKCAQVGSDDYETIGKLECQVYRRQLIRLYKAAHNVDKLPEGCTLKVTSNDHEYGIYHEVGARFDSEDEVAATAAFWFDSNIPSHWDDEAKMELQELIPAHNMLPSPNAAEPLKRGNGS